MHIGSEDVELNAVHSMFKAYDTDNSDSMSLSELPNLLLDMGLDLGGEDLRGEFVTFDVSGDERIGFNDYLKWWRGDSVVVSDGANCEDDVDGKNITTTTLNLSKTERRQRRKILLEPSVFLFIYKTRCKRSGGTRYLFFYESGKLQCGELSIDFSDSINLIPTGISEAITSVGNVDTINASTTKILNAKSVVRSTRLPPFSKEYIFSMTTASPTEPYQLKISTSFVGLPPPSNDQSTGAFLKRARKNNEEHLTKMLKHQLDVEMRYESFDPNYCKKSELVNVQNLSDGGRLFIDLDFPPVSASLGKPGTSSATFCRDYTEFTWQRSGDLVGKEYSPVIFSDGADPADIQQGYLGNCWLMSALAAISEQQHLVDRLFVDVSCFDCGMLRLKVCSGGVWETVALDDFFPCFPTAGVVFGRSENVREMWVPLVEKAFAKVSGSYGALAGGYAYEGMMDLTGCPSEMMVLGDKEVAKRLRSGEVFGDILSFLEKRFLVCCSTVEKKTDAVEEEGYQERSGLVRNHAYTLLNAVRLNLNKKDIMLLQVRNPWGGFEWNGDWSDNSILWTGAIREEISRRINVGVEEVVKEGDGTFWMSYDDWQRHFFSYSVCKVVSSGGQEWKVVRQKVEFVMEGEEEEGNNGDVRGRGKGKGGRGENLKSKTYRLSVEGDKTEVIVGLHQKDSRRRVHLSGSSDCDTCEAEVDDYFAVGISVLKKPRANETHPRALGIGGYSLVAHTPLCKERQNQVTMNLDSGVYLIVLWTTETGSGGIRGGMGGRRLEEAMLDRKNDESSCLEQKLTSVLGDVFSRYDADNDSCLSESEVLKMVDEYIVGWNGNGSGESQASRGKKKKGGGKKGDKQLKENEEIIERNGMIKFLQGRIYKIY